MKTIDTFIEESSITGLKEAYNSKNIILKLIWISLLSTGFVLTAYFLYAIVTEYQENTTATKVKYRKYELYDFPPILICPPYWVDIQKLTETNLSEGALMYAFSFFGLAVNEEYCYTITNDSIAEFQEYMRVNRVGDYIKFYENIAFDFDKIINQCPECNSFKKHFIEEFGICYKLSFKPRNINEMLMYQTVFINNLDLTKQSDYVKTFASYSVSVDPDITSRLVPEFIRLLPEEFNFVYIRPIITVSMDHLDRPCSKIKYKDYSQTGCIMTCTELKIVSKCNWCIRLGIFLNETNKLPFCNYCELTKLESKRQCKFNTSELYETCSQLCIPNCEQMTYQVSTGSNALWKDDGQFGGYYSLDDVIEVYFKYKVSLNGIEVHEEYKVYSIETMISNIGGVLGLWVGANVMTVAQLFIFVGQLAIFMLHSIWSRKKVQIDSINTLKNNGKNNEHKIEAYTSVC